MIEEVVSPVLHDKLPPEVVDNTEKPHSSSTETEGVDGVVVMVNTKVIAESQPAALVVW